MAIGDNVLTDGEIKAEQVSILVGEIEELREWIAQLKEQADTVRGCLMVELTERQYDDHCTTYGGGGCLYSLLKLIEEDAP